MDLQNLAYALTQIAHNFGAVAVVAGPIYALRTLALNNARGVVWVVLAGWLAQMVSGVLFGMVSLYYYGQLPDIHGTAVVALVIKILCAVGAVILIAVGLRRRRAGGAQPTRATWRILTALGVVALTAAAVLRWFS